MEIKEINLSDLKPYEHNNKVHDEEQIEMIANSIKEFWFTQPIVIDEDNSILAGHWRYYASQSLWGQRRGNRGEGRVIALQFQNPI